jgi:hypothetical protein
LLIILAMIATEKNLSEGQPPKLGLNRIEAAKAIGLSPASIDRLTQRGLLRPCRATYRPIYWVKELERFLKENSAADYIPSQPRAIGLPGLRAKKPAVVLHPKSNFPAVPPSATGNSHKTAEINQGQL